MWPFRSPRRLMVPGVALLLGLVCAAVWVRSHWATDLGVFARPGGRLWCIESYDGRLAIKAVGPWPYREPPSWRTARRGEKSRGPHFLRLPRLIRSHHWFGFRVERGQTVTLRDSNYRILRATELWDRRSHPSRYAFANDMPRMTCVSVDAPLWAGALLCATVAAVAPARAAARACLGRRRARRGRCAQCGYDVRFSRQRCPECGAVLTRPGQRACAAPRCLGASGQLPSASVQLDEHGASGEFQLRPICRTKLPRAAFGARPK